MSAIRKNSNLLSRLTVPQNITFHTTVEEEIKTTVALLILLRLPFQTYQRALVDALTAYNRTKKAPFSLILTRLEQGRDSLIKIVFYTVADRMKYSDDAAVQNAAETIMPILENYAKLEHNKIETETAQIEQFISALLAFPAELNTLGIINDVNFLRARNNEFILKYNERKQYNNKGETDNANYKHKELMKAAFEKLCICITALKEMLDDENDLANLEKIVVILNAIIAQNEIILHRHQAVLNKKKDGFPIDEDEEETDDFSPEEEDEE
jgi:hypothetical protein